MNDLEKLEIINRKLYRLALYGLVPLFALLSILPMILFLAGINNFYIWVAFGCSIFTGGFGYGLCLFGLKVQKFLEEVSK